MPWCGPCQRYFAPSALDTGGTCPVCGEAAEQADLVPGDGEEELLDEEARAPWHFWLVVVATVVYVGWRIVQLVVGAL